MNSWYAIMTAPQAEFKVAAVLRTYGYDVVAPEEVKFARNPRTKKRVMRSYPLFSRYLFVSREGGIPWMHLALKVKGYVGAVSIDGRSPTPIAASEVHRIRQMGRHPGTSVNPHRALAIGGMAYVAEGVYTGKLVKIEGLEKGKAVIMQSFFGAERKVLIPLQSLEAA